MIALSVLALHLALEDPARAQPSQTQLPNFTWNAPASCPGRQALVDEVRRLRTSSHVQHGSLRVAAAVIRDQKGAWVLTLETEFDSARGRRTIVGATCEEVSRAAAVMVALALDEQAPGPSATPAAQPAPPVGKPPAHTSTPTSPRWHLGARPYALVDAGTLPGTSPGFGLALMLGRAQWSGELRAHMLREQSVQLQGGIGRADVGLLAGGPWLCLDTGPLRWSAGLCAGAELGSMSGSSSGIRAPATDRSLWAGALVEGRGGVQVVGPLRVVVGAQVGASPVAPEAAIAGHGVVHQPSRVFGRGWIGVEVRTLR